MLELGQVAVGTGKLRAVELSMRLHLTQRHPDYFVLAGLLVEALVRELAEFDAILQYFIDLLEELSACIAVGAYSILA